MSYDLMFQKAVELQNAGALEGAEDLYLKILQAMPENSDVWNLLGLIAQQKGNNLRAVDCFLSAIKYSPVAFFAHFFNLGLSYKALNKPNEALEALRKSVELKADFREGWNFLGVCLAENGFFEEAVKSFCRALEIDGGYEDARVNLCFYTNDKESLFRLAEDEEAGFYACFMAGKASDGPEQKLKFLRRAFALNPERSDALLMLAEALKENDNLGESLIFYHKVLNLDDTNIEAVLGAADIYLQQDNLEKAEKLYKKSFQISREIAGAHLNYGILLYRQKRTAEALEEYREAVRINPERAEICYNLALILKENGDLEEALGLMFNAYLKDENNETYAINIMETLEILFQKNAEKALKIAQNWQKESPQNVFSKRVLNGFAGINENEEENICFAEKLFDNFYENYDETMMKIHSKVIEKFKETHGEIIGNVLDLGCGTGLIGAALKSAKNTFDGVDVSSKMLDEARKKGVYEHLYKDDAVSFLQKNKDNVYNIVLSFDVFCYFSGLEEVLRLVKGKEIWFSVESGDEEYPADYYPTFGGRYKHKISYVKRVLEKFKFKDVTAFPLVLREENGNDVNGVLFKAK